MISEPSVFTPVQETPSTTPVTTLPPLSVSTIPPVPHQTIAPIHAPPIITNASTITTVVPKSDALWSVQLRVTKFKKDVSELKKIDHSAEALATLKLQVPTVIDNYLTLIVDLEQESEKSPLEIHKIKMEQAEKQKMPRTKESESAKKPSTTKETSKGKAPSKGSKTGKYAPAKEPVKEPIVEVVMDDVVNIAGEHVVRDDDQPQDTSKPITDKTLNPEWFKQPSRPPTHDSE
nr:hypothetical protein [Tanacetum cinerariifolium]